MSSTVTMNRVFVTAAFLYLVSRTTVEGRAAAVAVAGVRSRASAVFGRFGLGRSIVVGEGVLGTEATAAAAAAAAAATVTANKSSGNDDRDIGASGRRRVLRGHRQLGWHSLRPTSWTLVAAHQDKVGGRKRRLPPGPSLSDDELSSSAPSAATSGGGRSRKRTRTTTYATTNSRLAALVSAQTSITRPTKLGSHLDAFGPVLKGQGILLELDTAHLLRACRRSQSIVNSVGLRKVSEDMETNIRKVEELYHKAPAKRRNTVSSLLEYERETAATFGGHNGDRCRGGGVKGISPAAQASSGLVWLQRSLSFQQRFFSKIIDDKSASTADAVMDAYRTELEPYHDMMQRKLYRNSFATGAPANLTRREALARIGGFPEDSFGNAEEIATRRDMRQLLTLWRPMLCRWKQNLP